MKGRPAEQLVYECMFPKPKSTDPQNFHGLLQRQLVPEVRLETQAFYGHLSSQEAKYPGLDYSYQPHRTRLSRYPWHRRLFRAFDNLRLTRSEIAGLTKWEGTRWAKERFEREQGIVIRDTTGDGIKDYVEPERRVPSTTTKKARASPQTNDEPTQPEGHEPTDDADDSDMDLHESVGIELNRRLRLAAAQREAGNFETPLDEEWEQWLKEAVEAGAVPELGLSPNANFPGTRPATRLSDGRGGDPPATQAQPPTAGQRAQVPDSLQSMMRQSISTATRRVEESLNAEFARPAVVPSLPPQNAASATVTGFPSNSGSSRVSTVRPLNPRLPRATDRPYPRTSMELEGPRTVQEQAFIAEQTALLEAQNLARFRRYQMEHEGRRSESGAVWNMPAGTSVGAGRLGDRQESRGN